MAGVGQYAKLVVSVGYRILHRLSRIVWHSIWRQLQRTDGKLFAVAAKTDLNSTAFRSGCVESAPRQPDRNPVSAADFEDTGDVVVMFMRNDDRTEIRRRQTKAR
jgi:hypothetical protein